MDIVALCFCIYGFAFLFRSGLFDGHQLIVAGLGETADFLVEADAGPGVGGGIETLAVGKRVGLPVGEPLALADLLVEEVGIELLQRLVLDARRPTSFCKSTNIPGLKSARWCRDSKSLLSDSPTMGTVVFSNRRMIAGVTPMRLRRNRKQVSWVET